MRQRDFDNDVYTSPRAWFHLKQIFEKMANRLPALAAQLEQVAHADECCVRLTLAAAIHNYVNLPRKERLEALLASLHTPESERTTMSDQPRKGKIAPSAGAAKCNYRMIFADWLGTEAVIDHPQEIIWIAANLPKGRRTAVIRQATEQAQREV
jgi:hypothetical protein